MVYANIEIAFQTIEQYDAFVRAVSGNDDILFAAEKAMNEVLGVDYYEDGVQVMGLISAYA